MFKTLIMVVLIFGFGNSMCQEEECALIASALLIVGVGFYWKTTKDQ
jgi:hypothetical protein